MTDISTHTFFCQKLPTIPAPPRQFVDQALAGDFQFQENQGAYKKTITRELKNWKGMSYTAPRIMRGKFNDEFVQWVKDNISKDFKDAGIAMFGGDDKHPSCGAHTDLTRDYVLIYNVDQGGPDAELTFWKEKGHPAIRERSAQGTTTENLEMLTSVRDLEGMWYLVDTRVLHSIENVIRPRINFQISFEYDLPEWINDLIKDHYQKVD